MRQIIEIRTKKLLLLKAKRISKHPVSSIWLNINVPYAVGSSCTPPPNPGPPTKSYQSPYSSFSRFAHCTQYLPSFLCMCRNDLHNTKVDESTKKRKAEEKQKKNPQWSRCIHASFYKTIEVIKHVVIILMWAKTKANDNSNITPACLLPKCVASLFFASIYACINTEEKSDAEKKWWCILFLLFFYIWLNLVAGWIPVIC